MAVFSAFILPNNLMAQTSASEIKVAPNNWYQLDRATTGYYGISLDKAYDLLKGKKSKTVVVAVIDSGIDTLQEDLKPILWTNPGEIPGNGIDDDKNGYVDDVHGWNFLGGKDGKNVNEDSYEAARVYWKLKSKYGDKDPDTSALSGAAKAEAITYLKTKDKVAGGVNEAEVMMLKRIAPILKKGDSIIRKDLGKEEFNTNDLISYTPTSQEAKTATAIYMNIAKINKSNDITNKQILDDFDGQLRKADGANTPPPNYRSDIVKDNYNDINDRYYGNNDIMANTATHGTHCSGIIAAVRNNGLGMNGIADNVRIMMIRAVPDGDEHDKDIANAIRYAVDNGAQVISMSFGKEFSPEKNWVDDAVKYAQSKDVLLVHAAGNDHKDIDIEDNFPNPVYLDQKGRAANFITVGASGDATNGGFTASFSNYGKKEVDVFAPGVNIYSTLPGGNKYGNLSGTSMAAPVVAGLAALIREYYPDLTAEQVKYVIEKSVTPIKDSVLLPGTQNNMEEDGSPKKVALADICKTGGEVNAYNAIKLAATIKGEKNSNKETLPKPKVKRKKRG
ncbi:MAG: S8 family peptidase [Bacteroidetes bacterium]|nr:S8 family peptidase [Bacteroidota bacterium]